MGNCSSKDWKRLEEARWRSQTDAAEWSRACSEPRRIDHSLFAVGLGMRRLQIVVCPSFEPGRAWEVRQSGDWALYASAVVSEEWEPQLIGYDRVSFSSERLAGLFGDLISTSLPLAPDLSGGGGLDGTRYQLAVYGDLSSEWRLQWWSKWPAPWSPVVERALAMDREFAAARASRGSQTDSVL